MVEQPEDPVGMQNVQGTNTVAVPVAHLLEFYMDSHTIGEEGYSNVEKA